MGQELTHFLVDELESFRQVIKNEDSNCISNNLRICSHVFELGDLQLLGSTQFFTLSGGFPLITLLLGMLHWFFFMAWKNIDSLVCVSNFLSCDVYLRYLLNFKIGLSLSLSCLMSPMFIIILVIWQNKDNVLR